MQGSCEPTLEQAGIVFHQQMSSRVKICPTEARISNLALCSPLTYSYTLYVFSWQPIKEVSLLWLRYTIIVHGVGGNRGWVGKRFSLCMDSDMPMLAKHKRRKKCCAMIHGTKKRFKAYLWQNMHTLKIFHTVILVGFVNPQFSCLAPETDTVTSSHPFYRLRNGSIG